MRVEPGSMIEIQHLSKTFLASDNEIEALKDISLTVRGGDIYGIIGMSGAGKSTLVRCINMLERPTSGKVLIDGIDMGALPPAGLRAARRNIAMIFQSFNLLMQRTCLANICFPLELAGMKKQEAREKALRLLEIVGLPDKAKEYPARLSGGQQQRIAIARALAADPKVLLCDEATSALDPQTTRSILSLIRDINRRLGITVIVITHQMSVVEEICNRVAILENGCVIEEGEVTEVFARPQSAAGQRLVFPEADSEPLSAEAEGRVIRLIFNGAEAAGQPIITQMAIDERIAANILFASTKSIGSRVYGKMLLGLPDNGEITARAIRYLTKCPNVTAEELPAKKPAPSSLQQ